MEGLFDRFFGDQWGFSRSNNGDIWMPALDIREDEKEIMIRAEIPGVAAKDVNVSVLGNVLTIAGQKEESVEDQGENYCMNERHFGSFRRTINLPEGVDPEKITAEQNNGVLTVKLPRLKTATPKHVPVRSSKAS
jgi:HSP20 family protein